MKLAKVLTVACAIGLTGCSPGGSDSSTDHATAAAVQPNQPVQDPSQTATDYSKVTCGSLDECARACDVSHPATTEALIRQNYCAGTPTSATCNALVSYHLDGYLASNQWCRSLHVADVLDVTKLGGVSCGDDSLCAKTCNLRYVPQSDEAIERAASANGLLNSTATLKTLIRNQVLREQLSACLDAPYAYVFGRLLSQ